MVTTNRRLLLQKVAVRRATVRLGWLALTMALLGSGCQSKDAALSVAGTVTWAGGPLTGHFVEVVQSDSPTTRGFGEIGSDGRFKLSRLVDGKTAAGLPPGNFRARLVLSDEGDGVIKKPAVPVRYLDFKTSGWTVSVPVSGDVTWSVPAK